MTKVEEICIQAVCKCFICVVTLLFHAMNIYVKVCEGYPIKEFDVLQYNMYCTPMQWISLSVVPPDSQALQYILVPSFTPRPVCGTAL